MLRRIRPLSHLIIGLAVLFAGSQLPAGQGKPPDSSELERVALEELRELNTPGAAIAIVTGNRVFAKGVGISNVETGAPVEPGLLFRQASVTKMFTAAALLSLAEQGRINLDEPIGRVAKGLHPSIARLTAHQLLTHTSGFTDDCEWDGKQDDDALAEEVRSWGEDQLFTQPDDVFSYSNTGYFLLGFVVSELTGKAYADAMAQLVFAPLGMTRTFFRPTMALTYPLAQGHDGNPPAVLRPLSNNAAFYPAEGMFSNVFDLSRFTVAFMNGGRLEGKQVLSPGLIEKMSQERVAIPGPGGFKYGYGLAMREYRGVRMVYHAGNRPGYGTFIWMVPDQRFAFIALTNRKGQYLTKTGYKAMEMVLKLDRQTTPKKQSAELRITDADKALWPGTYRRLEQEITVLSRDGKLFVRLDQKEMPVRKTGENRFRSVPPHPSRGDYVIVTGKDGKTLYLTTAGMSGRAAKKVTEN